MSDPATIARIFETARTVAVVGASTDPGRPSHWIGEYLREQGLRVVGVNPAYAGQPIYGQACAASLAEAAERLGGIDLVDVFRRTPDVLPVAEEAIAAGARAFWQQSGIRNAEADRRVREAGLTAVMDRCAMTEHRRWRMLGGGAAS